MLKIVVSYDYELFLGDNYKTPKEILFDPTDKLLDMMRECGITSTFFVDVCSVLAHKKYGLTDYVDGFEAQLERMVKEGHDIGLHIHPNWLLSEYKNGKWEIDTTHYTLHSFGFDEEQTLNAYSVIDMSIEYLENTVRRIKPNYKVTSYRAGGYSVQPHEELFAYLYKKGIRIDSSVCENLYCDSPTLKYDFRNIPTHTNWYINCDKAFSDEGDCNAVGLYEVPLLSEKNSLWKMLFKKGYASAVRTTALQGSYISLGDVKIPTRKISIVGKVIKYIKTYALVSFDSMPSVRMVDFLCKYEKKHKKQSPVISVICHPKLSDQSSLDNMRAIIKALKQKSERFEFTDMAKISTDIN